MANRQIVVEIVGDSKKFGKATKDAVAQTQTMVQRLDSTFARMTAKGGITGAILGGVGIGAGLSVFGMLKDAIGGVISVAGDAVRQFEEDQRSQVQLYTAIEANVEAWDRDRDAVEAVIASRMRLGFADEDQRSSLATLVAVTGDVTKALDIQREAMDLARLRGMSLSDASLLLGKVYGGNVGILKRYGIQLEKGATATEALAAIQKQANGQAEAYAATTQGKLAAAQLTLGEAMEMAGGQLAPFLESLGNFADVAIPQTIAAMGGLGDAFNALHRFIDPNIASLQDLEFAVRAEAVAQGLDADAAWDYVHARKEQQVVDEELERSIQRLVVQFGYSRAKAEEAVQAALELGDTYGDTADSTQAATDATKANTSAHDDATRYLGEYTAQVDGIVAAWDRANTAAQNDPMGIVAAQQIVTKNADLLLSVFDRLPPALQQAMRDAGLTVRQGAADIGDGTDQVTEEMRRLAHSGRTVPGSIRKDLSPLAGVVKGTLKAAIVEVRAQMADLNWALTHPLAGKRLENFYHRQLDSAYKKLHRAQATGNTIAIAKAQALIDDLTSKLNELRSVRISITTTLDNRASNRSTAGGRGTQPRAEGGPVSAFSPYVVGERGPELFVPRMAGTIVPSGRGGGGGGGMGGTYNIHVHIAPGGDLVQAGQQMVRAIQQYERRSGKVWRAA
jgi:hypothetical protein